MKKEIQNIIKLLRFSLICIDMNNRIKDLPTYLRLNQLNPLQEHRVFLYAEEPSRLLGMHKLIPIQDGYCIAGLCYQPNPSVVD